MLKSWYTKTNVFNRWVRSSTPLSYIPFWAKKWVCNILFYFQNEGKCPHFGIFLKNSEFKYNVHMQLESKCLIHP